MEITKQKNYEITKQEDAIAKAKKEGFEIIYTDEYTILLDLDGVQDILWYDYILPKLKGKFTGISEIERWPSKSGKGLHVILHSISKLTNFERNAFECILGSDRLRGMFNLDKIWNGVEDNKISILFKPLKEVKCC